MLPSIVTAVRLRQAFRRVCLVDICCVRSRLVQRTRPTIDLGAIHREIGLSDDPHRSGKQSPETTAVNLSLASLHPAKRRRYNRDAEEPEAWSPCGVVCAARTLGKWASITIKKRNGGWIMKAKSLLLTILVPVSGLTFLSLPAGAECWMTCPPGSTTTPSATKETGVTATAEPVSPEELTPVKTPEMTAKASPAPAKPKAAPTPAEATVEPVASPEELTPVKKPEATAKVSPAAESAKPNAAPTPAGASSAIEPSHVQSTSPAPAPTPAQDAGALPAPTPQPYGDNAAFQSPPAQGGAPAPVPIPGPVPGTATMHVIPE